MDSNEHSLPSEKLQKEFEENPFKILEIVRKDKEIEQTKELEKELIETNKNNFNNKKDVNYLVNNITIIIFNYYIIKNG
jgi:hypothetical protein